MWRVGVDAGGTFTDICLVDDASGPRARDRALVRRDLAEGKISEAVARQAYGLA